MNRNLSLYLDLVRVLAAIEVLLDHIVDYSPRNYFYHIGQLGHESVIVFFVLSGFVIAYSAENKDHHLGAYAVSRLARLWSVLLPCLILTPIFDKIGASITPEVYGYGFTSYIDLFDGLRTGLFLNQLWFENTWYFSSFPVWSLGYEFWYYAIFGAAFYLKGVVRAIVIAVCCLIAGPKILLLAPIWWLGVLVYRHVQRGIDLSRAIIYLTISSLGIVFYFFGGLEDKLVNASTAMLALQPFDFRPYSDGFLADYVLGLIIAGNFAGVAGISPWLRLEKVGPLIRHAAGYTFSIYLYHLPLFFLTNALFYHRLSINGRATAAFVVALAGSCLLGIFTERKKHVFTGFLRKLQLS